METTKVKQREMTEEKTDQTDNSIAATAVAVASSSPNLLDLPLSLLLDIFECIASIPDLFSFSAAICRPMRSLITSSPSTTTGSFPPLLHTPQVNFALLDSYVQARQWSQIEFRPIEWFQHPRCTIQTHLADDENPRSSYRTMVSSRTLIKHCIGYSHGHLIFVDGSRAVLADVFTGTEIESPRFPEGFSNHGLAILTAPISSSSSCMLVVVFEDEGTLFWRLGSEEWIQMSGLCIKRNVRSVAIFKEQIYFLDKRGYGLTVAESCHNSVSLKRLEVKPPSSSTHGSFKRYYLVQLGGDLLLVIFDHPLSEEKKMLEAKFYKLDLSKSEWVQLESLGDWCLFLDAIGVCPIACPNPSKWGGRSNSLYFAGAGSDGWSVFQLNDLDQVRTYGDESALFEWYAMCRVWPVATWVYPSVLY